MGLLDTLGGKLKTNMQDPLRMGLLAYGMTGQGQDSGGTAVNAMMQAQQAKAEREKAAAELARKQALQAQMSQAFAANGVTPELLANYSAGGGEGSKELIDMYKFGRTPQSVTPGSMIYNPTTGAMTMPAPKMGEGQMWDGQQVSSAPGYLQAYGDQKAVDAQNAIDQYAAQQGIGHRYGVDMLNRTQGYDWDKMDYADQITKGQEAFKAGLGAQGDLREIENPDGSRSYTSRADILAGGGMAARSPEQAAYQAERSKANAATYQGALDAATNAGEQLTNIDRMAQLLNDVQTGKGEQALLGLASIGEQLGLKLDPAAGDKQAAEAISNQLALSLHKAGVMTDKDFAVYKQSSPGIMQTPGGNMRIMETMAAFAEKKQKEAEIMQAYAERNGSWDDRGERLLNQWRKANPIKWGDK